MGLKIVHINKEVLCREAEAKTMWETVLKPKWEEQARERGAKLMLELKGNPQMPPKDSSPKMRG